MIEDYSLALPLPPTSVTKAPATQPSATQTALAELVATYSTLLFRVANSILHNPTEAEDTVQDTFLRVIEHQRALPAIRDLRVWLVRIAWNLALDRRRRIRPSQMDDALAHRLPGRNLAADAALHEAQQLQTVFRAIDRLPRAERQALLLSALDELTTAEIARIMHKSESAVRALIFRARARLRARLDPEHPRSPLEKGGKA